MKFTQEFKDKWIAALRSGEYKQCQSQLRNTLSDIPEYCCLGVLCEVNHITYTNTSVVDNGVEIGYDLFNDFFTNEVTKLLYMMNDIDNQTFSEIADYIESSIPVQE